MIDRLELKTIVTFDGARAKPGTELN